MAKKIGIFDRISQLVKANINDLLDKAEDPQKMLAQLILDYTNNIREAEGSVAQLIGNLRLLEKDYAEDAKTAKEWGVKALAASNKADEYRAAGDITNADKFDRLAKTALSNQLAAEKKMQVAEPQITAQTETVNKLKASLDVMRDKLEQVKQKKAELEARQKTAEATLLMAETSKNFNTIDPTSALAGVEEKVRRLEAKSLGEQELAESRLDDDFEALADLERDQELEARLAALKGNKA